MFVVNPLTVSFFAKEKNVLKLSPERVVCIEYMTFIFIRNSYINFHFILLLQENHH